jgi:hypothetical protein
LFDKIGTVFRRGMPRKGQISCKIISGPHHTKHRRYR